MFEFAANDLHVSIDFIACQACIFNFTGHSFTTAIAPKVVKILVEYRPIFLVQKERPKEAPFWT